MGPETRLKSLNLVIEASSTPALSAAKALGLQGVRGITIHWGQFFPSRNCFFRKVIPCPFTWLDIIKR